MDMAYAMQLYIDAKSGEALSTREPAVGVQLYYLLNLTPASPLSPFPIPKEGAIALDSPAEKVGTFDSFAVGVKAERLAVGLGSMARDGRPDTEIAEAIDRMCAWGDRIEKVRAADALTGEKSLAAACAQNPKDLHLQTMLLKRYVDELEKERRQALASPEVVGPNARPLDAWQADEYEMGATKTMNFEQAWVRLNTNTGQWEFSRKPTKVFSKYLNPAALLVRAIHAGPIKNAEFERQVMRVNLLAFGTNSALGNRADGIDPADPVALAMTAEETRQEGIGKLVNAPFLRQPKYSSSTTDTPLGGGGFRRTTSSSIEMPTPEELAAADRMEREAKAGTQQVARLQDLAMKLDKLDWRPYYLWARTDAVYGDKRVAGRVATRGLLIDPSSPEMHACRAWAFSDMPAVMAAEMEAAWKLARPYTTDDLSRGTWKTPLDPYTAYFVALQRVRMDPQHLGARSDMLQALDGLDGYVINNQEVMPDAREQHFREATIAALMAHRLRERPQSEWPLRLDNGTPATGEQLEKLEANFIAIRDRDGTTLMKGKGGAHH